MNCSISVLHKVKKDFKIGQKIDVCKSVMTNKPFYHNL